MYIRVLPHKGRALCLGYTILMQNINISQPEFFGSLWTVGWLFTIGYLELSFWKGVLALIIWPYYLGVHFKKPKA